MASKNVKVVGGVLVGAVVLAGLGVLIWFLVGNNTSNVNEEKRYTTQTLKPGTPLDMTVPVITEISGVGNMFWWFFHTRALGYTHDHPVILWLDGVTGVPPSLLANFGMFGEYDINLKRRSDSWIRRYNLLFIDAPLGTGFSTPLSVDKIPKNIDEAAEHLAITLESFYEVMIHFRNTPMYIFGEGHGAQLALALVQKLHQNNAASLVQGVILGNGLIAPAETATKLGFYLEELAYIDGSGRRAIDGLTSMIAKAEKVGRPDFAFELFQTLGNAVNKEGGAVAVNLGHIVQKLPKESLNVEYILQNTSIPVTIYNGNLDAVSNTPGQLEWVNNLRWPGQEEFLESPRTPLFVNGLLEGYYRNTTRLQFYWVNVAGQLVLRFFYI
ncbi:hypothetical protein HF086_003147 [Spodoptera exigua]|uniref:Uncharacterized protein n=1 Tax=Spodoptera exigua TaxID=7107 RepID=A0A922MFB4_SPOEX|nr:hypothetical protein HF086_003147 [Spodoptera exigua]